MNDDLIPVHHVTPACGKVAFYFTKRPIAGMPLDLLTVPAPR